MKVGRNLLVVADVAPATEWRAMYTDPALDSLYQKKIVLICVCTVAGDVDDCKALCFLGVFLCNTSLTL
jgi:hypothetical protein